MTTAAPKDFFGITIQPGDTVAKTVRVCQAATLVFRTVAEVRDGVVYTTSAASSRLFKQSHPESLVVDVMGRAGS